jgi:proline dehydrogenase
MIGMVDSSLARAIFARDGAKHPLVRRYVAGDQLGDAIQALGEITRDGSLACIDYLAEDLTAEAEVSEAMSQYIEVIKALSTFFRTGSIAIKPSAIGLAIDPDLARQNLIRLLDWGQERGGIPLTLDMEGSDRTDETLELARELHPTYPSLGTALQAYLRRTDKDLEQLIAERIPVRLDRGDYKESPAVAYTVPADIERQYRKHMFTLLEHGADPAIATHDPAIIHDARMFVRSKNIANDRFTFEMWMGVRPDLQADLCKSGFRTRIHVPYGATWYPYFTRRVADQSSGLGHAR